MPDTLQSHLATLRTHPESDARRAAAEHLGAAPTPEAVEALAGALADPHKGVRDAVHRALATIGGPGVARAIVPLIAHEKIVLRNLAADILSRLGEDARPSLEPYLRHPDGDVRKMAVDIFRILRSKPVTPSMLPLLLDTDPNVVVSAAEALGCIGDPRAVEPLMRVFDAEQSARPVAAEALGKIGGREAGKFLCLRCQTELASESPDPLTLFAVVEALGLSGEPGAVVLLCSRLPGARGALRRAMVTALLRIAGREAVAPDFPGVTMQDLIELLTDDNLRVCLMAMKALAPLRDAAVTAAFINALGSSEYFDLALFSELEWRDDAYPLLIEKLRASAGANVRSLMLLLRLLAERDSGGAGAPGADRELLDQAFEAAAAHWHSAEEETRGTIVETLFVLNGERTLVMLDSLLDDPDPWLRTRVIELLSAFHDERLPAFLSRYLADEDEMVCSAAAAVLEAKGYPATAPDPDGDAAPRGDPS